MQGAESSDVDVDGSGDGDVAKEENDKIGERSTATQAAGVVVPAVVWGRGAAEEMSRDAAENGGAMVQEWAGIVTKNLEIVVRRWKKGDDAGEEQRGKKKVHCAANAAKETRHRVQRSDRLHGR